MSSTRIHSHLVTDIDMEIFTMYNNTTIQKKPAFEKAKIHEHMLKRHRGDHELVTYA